MRRKSFLCSRCTMSYYFNKEAAASLFNANHWCFWEPGWRSRRLTKISSSVIVAEVMITFDYLQLRAFHAAVGYACGSHVARYACLPAAVRQCIVRWSSRRCGASLWFYLCLCEFIFFTCFQIMPLFSVRQSYWIENGVPPGLSQS